jgi:hypothetical protein
MNSVQLLAWVARARLTSSVVLVSLALPGIASAETTDRSAAVALFDEAERLMAAGDFAHACPKYAESERIDPQLGALLHLADCYEKAGEIASAWAAFRDAAELADRNADDRSRTARARATALEAKLPHLTIKLAAAANVAGLEVIRDGVGVSDAVFGVAVPVDPGDHVVEAQAPGKLPWKTKLQISAGDKNGLVTIPELAPAPVTATAAPGAGPTPSAALASNAAPAPAEGRTQRTLGWTALGLGAVGIGLGIVFEAQRGSKLTERDGICPSGVGCSPDDISKIDDLTNQARSAGTSGAVALVAGGVLAVGGVTLILSAPSSSPRVAFSPVLGAGFQGLMVTAHAL